jgi:hypothetical protein
MINIPYVAAIISATITAPNAVSSMIISFEKARPFGLAKLLERDVVIEIALNNGIILWFVV